MSRQLHQLVERKVPIGARSWSCDPNSPWQKGAVENTNKRIRRFMPGDTDLSTV